MAVGVGLAGLLLVIVAWRQVESPSTQPTPAACPSAACGPVYYQISNRTTSGEADSSNSSSSETEDEDPAAAFVPATPRSRTGDEPLRLTDAPVTEAAAQILSPVKQPFLIPTPGPTPLARPQSGSAGPHSAAQPKRELAGQALSAETATDVCPATSTATFDLIPIEGAASDRPDDQHADLNLSLRGYSPTSAPLALTFYAGATDGDAPQLSGLFRPNRAAAIRHGYRVNDWRWRCEGRAHGCVGDPIDAWDTTLIGLAATPGEPITIPERGANIYGGGYKALVLYAAERQVTLGYTRRDSVAAGYVVHIKDICVDPNLLALYRAQNSDGWRSSGLLPALRNDQAVGTALSEEVKVAVRDNGSFMDPRSSKDWWR